MIEFLAARATPGVERVDDRGYRRTVAVHGHHGTIAVGAMPGADALAVDVAISNPALVPPIVERVARMFDVDLDPNTIAASLSGDALLKKAWRSYAGIRLPGAWDPFELAVRAILGQQISVRAATTMSGRIAAKWGERVDGELDVDRLFPSPAALAKAPLEETGIIAARAHTIRTLAARVASRQVEFDSPAILDALLDIPGIGPWTAQYVAMRALRHADAFPSGDLVLRRVAGQPTPRALEQRAERWRPWRAYAVLLLWRRAAAAAPTPKRRLGAGSARRAVDRRKPRR